MNFGDPRLPDHFWAHVVPEPNSGCWLWTGRLDRYGYARTWIKGKAITGHRRSFLAASSLAPGLQLDHLCRVRSCVNPAHLDPVTLVENVMRGESNWAVNARRTTCKSGHPFDERNTYLYRGMRQCLECKKLRKRAARALQRNTGGILQPPVKLGARA